MTDFIKEVSLVWEYKDDLKYKFDRSGNCYNIKSGKQLKRTLIGYTEGYCLKGKFKSLHQIRTKLQKIKKIEVPF